MRLGYGLGIATVGTRGGVSDTPDVGGWLLDGETDGLAFDFAAFRAHIKDTATPANAYHSIGQISSSGALIGPAAKITYSSPSAKMVRQADGLLKYGAHNLYLNSAAPANQAITVLSGHTYAITITGTVSITWSGAYVGITTAGTTTFTAASGTLTGGSTSGSGTVHVYKTPAVSTYVATAGAAVYQLPYTYDINGDCEGILVEGASTNLLTYSEQFDNAAWVKVRCSITANATTAPDGTTTADKLVEDGTAGNSHVTIGSATVTANINSTCSVYAKKGERTKLWVVCVNSLFTNGYRAIFDLDAGTVSSGEAIGTGTYTGATIEALEDGWYRCSITGVIDSSSTAARLALYLLNAAGNSVYNGDGTSGIYIWGAQLEALTGPTSYIQTVAATVTRAVDTLTLETSLYPHSDTVGTAMVHYRPASVATAMIALRLDDGTANEVISLGHSAAAALGLTVTDGGAAQTAPLTDGTAVANTFEKIAASWKANDFLFSDNGATAATDTSGTLPTVTSIDIGPTLTGTISAILILPAERTAAEVEEIAS